MNGYYVKVYPPAKKDTVALTLPWSKSVVNRMLVIHALAGQPLPPLGNDLPDDIRRMAEGLQTRESTVNAGDAGTVFRFLTAYYAIQPGNRKITGSKRLLARPVMPLIKALQELGAKIKCAKSKPPEVTGAALQGTELNLPHDLSSQFVSALLLIGPYVKDGLIINVPENQVSVSYIHTTTALMQRSGANLTWRGNTIMVKEGGYTSPFPGLERDWSAACYWMSWLTVSKIKSIKLPGLFSGVIQADEQFARITQVSKVSYEGGLQLHQGPKVADRRKPVNLSNMPDQALTLACMYASVQSKISITGLRTLTYKESDRIEALATELRKCGTHVNTTKDSLSITGFFEPGIIPAVNTHNDHRMAMSLALLAVRFPGIKIYAPGVVAKSYPAYWKDLQKAGVHLLFGENG